MNNEFKQRLLQPKEEQNKRRPIRRQIEITNIKKELNEIRMKITNMKKELNEIRMEITNIKKELNEHNTANPKQ